MSYTKNELGKKQALKDLARSIIGDTAQYTVKELSNMKAAVQYNEDGCVAHEHYHLAECWKELSDELELV